MKIAKPVFASLLSAGLIAAPLSAQAADTRRASTVSQDEGLGGSSFLPIIGVLAAAVAVAILLSNDNNSDTSGLPSSP